MAYIHIVANRVLGLAQPLPYFNHHSFAAFLFLLQLSVQREPHGLHCQIPETRLVFSIITVIHSYIRMDFCLYFVYMG